MTRVVAEAVLSMHFARFWRIPDVYVAIDDVTTPYESQYVIVPVIIWFRNLSIVTHSVSTRESI